MRKAGFLVYFRQKKTLSEKTSDKVFLYMHDFLIA